MAFAHETRLCFFAKTCGALVLLSRISPVRMLVAEGVCFDDHFFLADKKQLCTKL